MAEPDDTIGFMRRVDAILDEMGRKTPWLAELVGESEVNLSRLRNGKQRLRWDQALSIAGALGASLDRMAGQAPAAPGRSAEERLLLDVVLGGDRPLGADEAIRLINLGLRLEAERLRQSAAELPPRITRKVVPPKSTANSAGKPKKKPER